jgi:uncharacterized protein
MKDAELRKQIKLEDYVSEEIGLPTLNDIISELAKPGRDPREQFEVFSFTEGVNAIADLKVGMKLPGIVTNITNFGAFVDIGVHQDGLVHTSQLANKFVSNANEVVKVAQKVEVTVVEVDVSRKRISLSMRTEAAVSRPKQERKRENVKPKNAVGVKQSPNKPDQQKRPAPAANAKQLHSKPVQREKKNADGDLQTKLEALKNLFK